ncbi:hypothetical protein Taro_046102 [Colocasia esculenta]|uniref:Uncharacterized protein n=1 Tax=Colocasia esculenta TaxID=4460 RepID=A0A843WSX3_COLES|nr:hypothetical protein [Colocasia esculenta]
MLELAVELADSGTEGKTRFGQWRRVVCRALLVGLGCRGRMEFFPVQTNQSFFSLPRPALVLEPHREVRREATAWQGCGCCCVVVFLWRLSLALLGRQRQELGCVSSRRFQVCLVAQAYTAVIAWLFPFLGASPWWHQRVWLPDLVVCRGFGVVLFVGPRPCGGAWLPCKFRVHAVVGCICCCIACVASVVAQCVRAVVARLAVDSLAVVFLEWRTIAGKSKRALRHLSVVVVGLVLTGCELWLRCIAWLPGVLGLRCAVGLTGAFWRAFPERCLGGSGGVSPRTGLHCFCSSACCSVLSDGPCCLVIELCVLVKVLPRITLYLAIEVVLLALARQGVAVVFAPLAAESVLRVLWRVPFGGPWAGADVACCALFRLVVLCVWLFGGSLVKSPSLLECFDFVLFGALVYCVVPWVAPGACDSTTCCNVCLFVALSVVRQALVVASILYERDVALVLVTRVASQLGWLVLALLGTCEEEGHAWCPGIVELAWSEEEWIGSPSEFVVSVYCFSMLPSPVWCCVWLVGGLGMEHPMGLPLCWCRDHDVRRDTRRGVCPVGHNLIPTRCPVTIRITVVTRFPIATRYLVATRLLSRCLSPSRWYRDGLGGRVSAPCAPSVPWFRLGCRRVPQCRLALRTFRWGMRQLTRACLGWPTALLRFREFLVLAGLVVRYKPAILHAFGATSVLEFAVELADSGAKGKTSSTDVGFLTSCGYAEGCFRFVPDSVGFCGSRVCVTILVGGRGIALFYSAA